MFSLQTLLLRRNLKLAQNLYRNVSTRSSSSEDNAIVVTDDGSTIVCWHPEKEFPYEYTRPMPETLTGTVPSVLKTDREMAMKVIGKKQHPEDIREELAKLTHTTIHRWFPRSRDKKAKKTARDREFL